MIRIRMPAITFIKFNLIKWLLTLLEPILLHHARWGCSSSSFSFAGQQLLIFSPFRGPRPALTPSPSSYTDPISLRSQATAFSMLGTLEILSRLSLAVLTWLSYQNWQRFDNWMKKIFSKHLKLRVEFYLIEDIIFLLFFLKFRKTFCYFLNN